MQLLLAFLFGMFVIGGLVRRPPGLRKPSVVLGTCVAVGVMFYSSRVL